MTRRATTNEKALDAFIAAKTEIDAMLERRAVLSADRFEASCVGTETGHQLVKAVFIEQDTKDRLACYEGHDHVNAGAFDFDPLDGYDFVAGVY